ncbi:phthioceranic/hydroxyphthioceranic acid synthase-like [Engraulis encrasicolus]|uniref:phthioceranic/hydroxyphthioceranic acid synthase-like n=1 Tax=Engraulis encrasicolus TaxID=184585 RepID=UPI002FD156B8
MSEDTDGIAIVGIGCNFPGGEGLDNFWDVLQNGKNCAVDIPKQRFDCSYWYDRDENKPGKSRTCKAALIDGFNEFDHKFFGITAAEADLMDPQQKLLLQSSYRALEDAGIPMEKASGTRTGVFVGLMNRDYELVNARANPNMINHCTGTGMAPSIVANRISYTFNLTGPSQSIDCACSSSLVALHSACQAIKQGDCEMALCAGVNCIIDPKLFVALSKAKMISPDGTSKPFSSKADGYGRGEGCGVVLLKPLRKALQDSDHIWGVVRKTAVNQDGRSVTPITKPSMVQQEELLSRIYSTEDDLASVQYIEAHGTGTPVGDPIEASSISNVIAKARSPRSEPLVIGSVKGNIGHTESAAGVAGLIKVLLMMKHETIVPSVFYSDESASIDINVLNLRVPTKVEKWQSCPLMGRVAGINNFGFGGTNAHAIVQQIKHSKFGKISFSRSHHVFVLSTASEKTLAMTIKHTAEELKKHMTTDIATVAYTAACRRTHFKHRYRKAFLSTSLTDLTNQLVSAVEKKVDPSTADPKLVFVFCGNGVTYRGMCKQLLLEEPVFYQKVKEVENVFQNYRSLKFIEQLQLDTNDNGDFSKPDIIQPILFAIQVATAAVLKHWGVRPDAILGHSVGEVAAAHCSGLLSLEDAVKVIHHRSNLQSKVTGGKMLVVSNVAVTEVLEILSSYSGKISLAAINSPQSCTVSGDAEAIDNLHQILCSSDKFENIFLRILDVPAAYHSHMMDPILTEIEEQIGILQENTIETEIISTVTGNVVAHGDFVNGKYWAQNIRQPVSFEKAVRAAAKGQNVIFLEISPRRALQRNITETLGNDITVLSSVQPKRDYEAMLSTVGKLFEMGCYVDWNQFYQGFRAPPTSFPQYQFDNIKHDVIFESGYNCTSSHPVISKSRTESNVVSCDLTSDSLFYLNEHKNNGIAIIPGALYVEIALAVSMEYSQPKVPLNTLQITIIFQNPFVFSPNSPQMKAKFETAGNSNSFEIFSNSATYATGTVEARPKKLIEERRIALDSVCQRCQSVVSAKEFYKRLYLGGFEYGNVFQNKGDVFYGEELREAYSVVTVPNELLPQLHDYFIHPVVLDYLMQLLSVTSAHQCRARPGFPARIGSLTVMEPLQSEMVVYLRAVAVGADDIEVCECFTDKEGTILVELKNVMVRFVGSSSRVVEEFFFHNTFNAISHINEDHEFPKALVFADQSGMSDALKKHLSPESRFVPLNRAKVLLSHGVPALLSQLNISDVGKTFTDVLYMWGHNDVTNSKTDDILESVTSCCEMLRQIVSYLKECHFPHSIRVVTYQSSGDRIQHISPGFALPGMTRACAAEISDMSFQLIDIDSISVKDIEALSKVLTLYPCNKFAELLLKDGQIHQPQITRTKVPALVDEDRNAHCSLAEYFTLQTADPFKMTRLSAIMSEKKTGRMDDHSVEVDLCEICVHSTDYFPVSASDLNFGQTIYWNKHTSQNHKLLALDFNGTVKSVGKAVQTLKVGDHIAACYPTTATSTVVIPADVCYKTKEFPIFKKAPCVSQFLVTWDVLRHAPPKTKHCSTLGILTAFPDANLVSILTLVARRTGWHVTVGPNASCGFDKVSVAIFLPPLQESNMEEVMKIDSISVVLIICDNHTNILDTHRVCRSGNAQIHLICISSIMHKGNLFTQKPHFCRWLKLMQLNNTSLDLKTSIFQRASSGNIDLSIEGSESYFNCEALRLVAVQKKVVLSDILLLPQPKRLFQKNGVYIVAGGLSGLGFETVRFIAQKGGGHIIILSRRRPDSAVLEDINNIHKENTVDITSLQCDVSNLASVEMAIEEIGQIFPACEIRGVFHSAVVLHDGFIESLNKSLYEKVMKPKVTGVLNLHHATRHCVLDYFVCYSSISSFLGNASQTNYAAANAFMDTFCEYRRNLGLPGQSIIWGALNTGLLLNKEHFHKFLDRMGLMLLDVSEIHESLEQCLVINKPQQVVCKFNFKNMRYNVLSQNNSLAMRMLTIVEDVFRRDKMLCHDCELKPSVSSPTEYIKSVLSETIVDDDDQLNEETSLSTLGIDSMLAMTLQNVIFQDRGVNIPLVKLLDPNSTVATLVAIVGQHEKDNDDHEYENEDTKL